MNHYSHLTTFERECIFSGLAKDKSITEIALDIKRSKSTVSREIKRNR